MSDAQGKATPAKLAVKDWLGIVFSSAALLISATSFYFSNLRVDQRVIARIADIAEDDDDRGYPTYRVDMAIANTGNRPAIVTRAGLYTGRTEETAISTHSAAPDLPFVIQPNEVRLLSVSMPRSMLVGVGSKSLDDYLQTPKGPVIRMQGYLRFEAFNSCGEPSLSHSLPLFSGESSADLKEQRTSIVDASKSTVVDLLQGASPDCTPLASLTRMFYIRSHEPQRGTHR